jgi:crotonobetainyl-CoA:carnitine CoA-transferase CaiB-like acyl-CoA transferase
VVKVDSPDGDYVRYLPPLIRFKGEKGAASREHGALFEQLNAGKRGLGVDLKHKEAAGIIKRLIPHFDVLIEGSRPGVMDKLGLGYEELSKVNPKLVYCSLSGYGKTGLYARRAGHDINYMATAGVLGISKDPSKVIGFQAADGKHLLSLLVGSVAILTDVLNKISVWVYDGSDWNIGGTP